MSKATSTFLSVCQRNLGAQSCNLSLLINRQQVNFVQVRGRSYDTRLPKLQPQLRFDRTNGAAYFKTERWQKRNLFMLSLSKTLARQNPLYVPKQEQVLLQFTLV